jgi:putative ABC transport system permease protein
MIPWLAGMASDLRYAGRSLLRKPGFGIAVIATLALAIGANCAIFTVVRSVLLRPLPFGDPDALVAIWCRQTARDKAPFNLPDFIDLRDRNKVLEQIAGVAPWSATLTGDAPAERFQGMLASANLFSLLRTGAAAGRTLVDDDDRPGAQRVVVLTDALWRRRFGASASILGKPLVLDGNATTVVGVLPPDFVPPLPDVDLIAPLAADSDPRAAIRGSISFVRLLGRLEPGVSRARAEEDLGIIVDRLRRDYPDTNARKIGARVVPLAEELVSGFRGSLMALLGAVGAVLLIACANLASLFLARGASRRTEMASRLALGATPALLIRQLLTEVALFASLGGVCGALLAAIGIRLLAAMAPHDLPRRGEIHLDGAVLLFTAAISLIAVLVIGVGPALLAARTNVMDGLKARARGSSGNRRDRRLLGWLVGAELLIAQVLLVVAGLMARTFANLQEVRPGFNPGSAISARVSLSGSGYGSLDAFLAYQRLVEEHLASLPAVESAGAISIPPLSSQMVRVDFTVEGIPLPREKVPTAQYRMTTAGYFEAMGVPLKRGRLFTPFDAAATAPVMLVNETLARRYFSDRDPIGARLLIDDNNTAPRPVEIIGVVGDVKHLSLEGDPTNDLYLPYTQLHLDNLSLATANLTWIVRTRTDPLPAARSIRDAMRRADAGVPIESLLPLEDLLSGALASRRFHLLVITLFAAAAVLLAAAGSYSVLSYALSERVDELAIRRALGARPAHILWLVLSQAMRPALLGIALGAAAALGLTRLLTTMLFGVRATDPATFAGVALGLAAVTAAACFAPALSAARRKEHLRI